MVVAVVLSAVGWSQWLSRAQPVVTALEALLPPAPEVETRVMNTFRDAFSGKGLIAIIVQDEQTLESALDVTFTFLDDSPQVGRDDAAQDAILEFVDELAAYRFELVSPEDVAALQSQDVGELQAELNTNMFGLPTSIRLLPISEDPYNLFGRFAQNLMFDQVGAVQWDDGYFFGEVDNQVLAIVPFVDVAGATGFDNAAQFSHSIQALSTQINAQWPQSQVLVSSAILHIASATDKAQSEITLFSSIAVLAILGLFVWAFRSGRALLFTISSIAFGCAVGVAVVSNIYAQLHVVALVFGCSLIGVGVDYALHYVCMGSADNLRRLRSASLLALLSTGAAYGLLMQAEIPVVAQIALLSCCGLAGSWLFVVALFDLVMAGPAPIRSDWLLGIATSIQRIYEGWRRRTVLWLWGILVMTSSVCVVLFSSFDNSVRSLYEADQQLIAADQQIGELMGRISATQYVIVSATSVDALLDQMHKVDQQLEQLQSQGLLGGYQMLSKFLPARRERDSALQATAAAYGPNGLAYEDVAMVAEAKSALLRSYAQASSHRIEDQHVATLAQRYLPQLWVGEIDGVFHAAVSLFDPKPALASTPIAGARFIDITAAWSEQLARAARRAVIIFVLGVFAVACLLMLWLRRGASLVIGLVPLTAGALVLGGFSALGVSITLFHIFGLYLVVGLGFDYGIFAFRDNDEDARCYLAILLSAVTTMLAFGLLSLSSTPMIAAFGTTVMCGTMTNLLLVPGVRLFRRSGNFRQSNT